jgi:hypothetical protein
MTLVSRILRWITSIVAASPERNVDRLPPPDIPGLLPDIPGGEPNLLPKALASKLLRVEFKMWQNSNPEVGYPEHLTLYMNGMLVQQKTWTTPVLPSELYIMIQPNWLIEGEHTLHYVVMTFNGMEADSEELIITIDKTAPMLINDGPLEFPPEVISGGVTEQYLKANGDQLVAEVPDYDVPKPGDILTFYWGSSATGSAETGTLTLTEGDIGQPITVTFTGAMILERGDGLRYAYYRIDDRAGNRSQKAEEVALTVKAKPVPRVLPPVDIKDAPGSEEYSTLNPLDAINGATVIIRPNAVINEGESVVVQWADPGSPGAYRTDAPIAPDLRQYLIPKAFIPQHIDKVIPVTYEVFEPGVADPHRSRVHYLTVSRLTGLPIVQCTEVSGNTLSLAQLVGGYARFTLDSWPFMATDQFLDVWVQGVNSAGQGIRVDVWKEQPVPEVANKIDVGRISVADLQRFQINQQLDFKASVSFNGKRDWIAFGTSTATLIR